MVYEMKSKTYLSKQFNTKKTFSYQVLAKTPCCLIFRPNITINMLLIFLAPGILDGTNTLEEKYIDVCPCEDQVIFNSLILWLHVFFSHSFVSISHNRDLI